jgi:hypothetical protein
MLVVMLVPPPDANAAALGEAHAIAETLMHLVLHIELGTQPVTGSLASAEGPATQFSGYTGLIAALEAFRLGDREQEDTEAKEQA